MIYTHKETYLQQKKLKLVSDVYKQNIFRCLTFKNNILPNATKFIGIAIKQSQERKKKNSISLGVKYIFRGDDLCKVRGCAHQLYMLYREGLKRLSFCLQVLPGN